MLKNSDFFSPSLCGFQVHNWTFGTDSENEGKCRVIMPEHIYIHCAIGKPQEKPFAYDGFFVYCLLQKRVAAVYAQGYTWILSHSLSVVRFYPAITTMYLGMCTVYVNELQKKYRLSGQSL